MKLISNWLVASTLFLLMSEPMYAQLPAPLSQGIPDRQRYDVRQTFDGRPIQVDNNIWVYDEKFAGTFGMSVLGINKINGAAAAAFRVETSPYVECGFGANVNACRPIDRCFIDLFFDESNYPLPWVAIPQSQWYQPHTSLRWLSAKTKEEGRFGFLPLEAPPQVKLNDVGRSPVVAFADPVSKVEALFTTNAFTDEVGEDVISGAMALLGYSRKFYRDYSLVSLQFGCARPSRDDLRFRLDAIEKGIFTKPIASFNRVTLPSEFGVHIKALLSKQSDERFKFFKDLLTKPAASLLPQQNSK
jgi:hypothetical protein